MYNRNSEGSFGGIDSEDEKERKEDELNNNEDISYDKSNDYIAYVQNEYDYTRYSTEGMKLLMEHDYESALEQLNEALKCSNKLNDHFRKHEASINLSVCNYLTGKINNCLNILDFLEKNISGETFTSKLRDKEIIIKLCCNLSMCYLTLNKTKESESMARKIMEFIRKETNLKNRIWLLKLSN